MVYLRDTERREKEKRKWKKGNQLLILCLPYMDRKLKSVPIMVADFPQNFVVGIVDGTKLACFAIFN